MTSLSIAADIEAPQQSLETLVHDAVTRGKARGAAQVEVAASIDDGFSVNVRLGEVETLEYQRDRALVVTVYFDQRKGSASSADFNAEAVRETIDKACSIARFTAADPCAGLADAGRMATNVADLDLDHSWPLTPQQAIEHALRCETVARDYDPRINNSEGASVSTHRSVRVYGNSHGFIGGFPSSYHSVSCSVVAEDDSGMQRDFWYSAARDPAELDTPEDIGRVAAERTVRRLGARKIKTRQVPVLYPAYLARGLIGHFLGALYGSAQYREASYLLGALDSEVFPSFVNIAERPHIPKALGSKPIDAEGVATQDREIVEAGVVRGYVLSSYSARRLGMETTANAGGIHNMIVSGGERSFVELVRAMGTGFVVGELIGHGVNATTGDYSRGAAGYWVEGGEIAYPVHEVTVAGNLKDMFRQVVEIGSDIDARGKVRTGSILVDGMTIAGD